MENKKQYRLVSGYIAAGFRVAWHKFDYFTE